MVFLFTAENSKPPKIIKYLVTPRMPRAPPTLSPTPRSSHSLSYPALPVTRTLPQPTPSRRLRPVPPLPMPGPLPWPMSPADARGQPCRRLPGQ
jgi:hypothetical protein